MCTGSADTYIKIQVQEFWGSTVFFQDLANVNKEFHERTVDCIQTRERYDDAQNAVRNFGTLCVRKGSCFNKKQNWPGY